MLWIFDKYIDTNLISSYHKYNLIHYVYDWSGEIGAQKKCNKIMFLMIAEVKSLRRCEKAYTGCCDTSKYHIYLVVNGKDNSWNFLKDLHAKCQVRYICTLINFNVTQIATTCMNALMLFHLSKCNGGWTEKWE